MPTSRVCKLPLGSVLTTQIDPGRVTLTEAIEPIRFVEFATTNVQVAGVPAIAPTAPSAAAESYSTEKSATSELTCRPLNDNCGDEPDGPAGFGSKSERARLSPPR